MKRRILLPLSSLALFCGSSSVAFAHPGHGVDPQGQSWLHWMLEPAHGLPLLLASALMVASAWFMTKHHWR